MVQMTTVWKKSDHDGPPAHNGFLILLVSSTPLTKLFILRFKKL